MIKTDGNGNPLANAEFVVLDEDRNKVHDGLESDADGRVIITDLTPGKYTLVETKAPEGYVLSDERYTFEIEQDAEGEPEIEQITVINELEPEKPTDFEDPEEPSDDDDSDLPTTGESGTYTLLGFVLLVLGGALALYDKKWANKSSK